MYNIVNFRKYLHNNKELLIQCIKEESDYDIVNWDNDLGHGDDMIFYHYRLLFTNFLKWCSIK